MYSLISLDKSPFYRTYPNLACASIYECSLKVFKRLLCFCVIKVYYLLKNIRQIHRLVCCCSRSNPRPSSSCFIWQHCNQPWWPSGLRQHAISQLIVATEGPRFESLLGVTILIQFASDIEQFRPSVLVCLFYLALRTIRDVSQGCAQGFLSYKKPS